MQFVLRLPFLLYSSQLPDRLCSSSALPGSRRKRNQDKKKKRKEKRTQTRVRSGPPARNSGLRFRLDLSVLVCLGEQGKEASEHGQSVTQPIRGPFSNIGKARLPLSLSATGCCCCEMLFDSTLQLQLSLSLSLHAPRHGPRLSVSLFWLLHCWLLIISLLF